ncbi:hypothetical protein N7509_001991 [Penicillium cosmopolitanum]|uniref:RING-type domain-containing protein n=1 Tax=Penicillium cosmopolitanum TaxID=1131564 RepID=A0A9W9W858_9EURO|nr:uncharacterized protein N7509_001991 [Penicillium cosmopolitanum]KAJ5408108.1 hypothetical protein N7509_001991 [Penicillium cosmopolitanum]
MGQSSSTARDPPDIVYPDYLTPHSVQREHSARNEDMNNRQPVEQNGQAGSLNGAGMSRSNGQETGLDEANESTETWQQPTLYSGGSPHQMRSIEEEGNAELQDADERAYRSAAIARMVRRQSTMSRLGSRLLPNSVIRGLLNSQEETPAEGLAHRHGLVSRTPPRSETGHSSGRFSPFSALGSRGVTRRRSTRGPYFIPSREDSSGTSDGPNNERRLPEPNRASWRRSARLNRVRHSISTPISHMFGQPHSELSPPHEYPPHLSGSHHLNEPLPHEMDTRLDWRESIGEPSPDMGGMEPPSLTAGLPGSDQPNPGIMGVRRLPSLIRARPPRTLRQQEQTPLSRVLQIAAAAIAAQLSGTTGPAMPNIQALGNDGLDGSLENFIQSLQHATSPQEQPSSVGGEGPSHPPNDRPTPPVNFLRVFRFANSDSPNGSNPLGSNPENSDNRRSPNDGVNTDEPPEGAEGRTVTLVVVGVRSVPSGNGANSDQGPPATGGAGLDALLGLPFLPRPQDAQGDLGQGTEGHPRMPAPRPGSLAGVPSPRVPDFLRQAGLNPSRRMSDAGHQPATPVYPPSAMSESPPGPHPPPSTPAEQGLSAVSSGTSTPSRRPSSASALSPALLPHLHEGQSMQPPAGPSEDAVPLNAARQRRRSDSEFARHRALGSGGGRSWLIYVVGTNLSENHPALTTPSLFTDNPTYEDMILLSSLLGPAKPPVASQDDVNSAGGLFRLVEYSGSLVAESVDGAGVIQISDGERCLICLSDYEVAEEVRELNKCKHVFHRDCIDQWLTTGRNSCPLCRGEGVHETSNSEEPATSEPPPAFPGTAI